MPRDEIIRRRAVYNLLDTREFVDPLQQSQFAGDIELFLKWLRDPKIKAIDSVIWIEEIDELEGWPFYQFLQDKLDVDHLFDEPGRLYSTADETDSELHEEDSSEEEQETNSEDEKENQSRAANETRW
jgi:hypothetical protein